MKHVIVILCASLTACGSSGSNKNPDSNGSGSDASPLIDASIDAPPAPAMITISGTVTQTDAGGTTPLQGATVGAYRSSNETTAVATATSNAQGKFMMTITTGGVALDGFLKSTKASYTDTYLYATAPITMDMTNTPVNMVTTGNFQFLSTLAQG